jgi:hypothetical protein
MNLREILKNGVQPVTPYSVSRDIAESTFNMEFKESIY